MPLACWEQHFPDCAPVAHWLKAAFPERWVRFHSLTGSKRYPDNEAEYATVLERHNHILADLTGSERSVVLLSPGASASPNPVRAPEWEALDPEAVLWRSVPMHELEEGWDEPHFLQVFASIWEWRWGLFDPIVRLVADDVLWNVMVVNAECRWLLHPYDGGMDVIAESSVARDQIKSSHLNWLSPRPDGS